MSRKIFRLLGVIVEGPFSGKCDSCRHWKCCLGQIGQYRPGEAENQASNGHNLSRCPVIEWVQDLNKLPG